MRKYVRAVVLLTLIAVLVTGVFALSACGKTGDKSGGKGGSDSQSGGVFSPDMSYEEFIKVLTTMTNWTSSYSGTYYENGVWMDDDQLMISYVDGYDCYFYGKETSYSEYVYCWFNDDDHYYYIEADRARESAGGSAGFDLREGIVSEEGEQLISYISLEEYVFANPALEQFGDAKIRRAPDDALIYLIFYVTEKEGKVALNTEKWSDSEGKLFMEFKDNGITVGYTYEFTEDGVTYSGTIEWSLTDVGETEVVIPDEIKALKSQCTFVTE